MAGAPTKMAGASVNALRALKQQAKAERIAVAAETHGNELYVYHHIQTKQVVYSLTKNLNNNDSIKQLPFIGKKSVPRALRKDHWAPLASVSFPKPSLGLTTYQLLREFRRLHETCYDKSLVTEKTRKERKWMIMDQKANSVADLAASLRIAIETENKKAEEERRLHKIKYEKTIARLAAKAEAEGTTFVARPLELEEGEVVHEGDITVRWRNMNDKEHAEEWPHVVSHAEQGRADRPYVAPRVRPAEEAELVIEVSEPETEVIYRAVDKP
ncbi:transcriptional regulation of mitochondrial recombination-domain-containing protein [Pyronema domesticum]|nr:transcriptional regulation of mitochondrial recombination-domain-containing protein [Pyronema domesticum]